MSNRTWLELELSFMGCVLIDWSPALFWGILEELFCVCLTRNKPGVFCLPPGRLFLAGFVWSWLFPRWAARFRIPGLLQVGKDLQDQVQPLIEPFHINCVSHWVVSWTRPGMETPSNAWPPFCEEIPPVVQNSSWCPCKPQWDELHQLISKGNKV